MISAYVLVLWFSYIYTSKHLPRVCRGAVSAYEDRLPCSYLECCMWCPASTSLFTQDYRTINHTGDLLEVFAHLACVPLSLECILCDFHQLFFDAVRKKIFRVLSLSLYLLLRPFPSEYTNKKPKASTRNLLSVSWDNFSVPGSQKILVS